MSGIQEILLVVLLAVVVVLLPRMRPGGHGGRSAPPVSRPVSGPMRAAIVASLLWPAGAAALMEPWREGWPAFLWVGVAPVAVLWALKWVLSGFPSRGGRR